VKEAMFVHTLLTVSPKMKHRIAVATASIARVILPKVWEERI
jgi:hypothetical protein